MKKIVPHLNGRYLVITVFSMLFFLIFADVSAQQIIYRKNGTTINAEKLERTSDKSFTYQLATDSVNVIHYISSSQIDSIRHADGNIEIVSRTIEFDPENERPKDLSRNRIGTDVLPFFYSKINLFYERLFLDNRLGIKSGFLLSANSQDFTNGNLYRSAQNYFRTGLNYYYLNSYLFEFGIGASLIVGKLHLYYNYYLDDYDPEEDTQSVLLFNTSFGYKISQRFKLAANFEFPMGMNHDYRPSFIQFQTELSINF